MLKKIKLFFSWIYSHRFGIIATLACVSIIFLTIASIMWICPQQAQSILLGSTLIVLVLYTYFTALLTKYSRLSLVPVVSYMIKDVLADPATRTPLTQVPTSIEERIQYHSTMFYLENVGDRWAKVFVRLNLRVSGQQVELSPFYNGESYWTLLPHQRKWGHFEIRNILNLASVSSNEALQAYNENPRGFLTMNLEIEYYGATGIRIKEPPQEHYFDFDNMNWRIMDVGPIPGNQ